MQSGLQLLQQGRLAESRDAFEALVRLDPTSAVGHHMVGLIALQTGQFEAGVESLRRSIALDPRDPSAYGNLANGLRELGRDEEAMQAYDTAIAMNPGFLNALGNRAILLARLGRLDEALADYDRALAQNERVPALHNQRAAVLKALGRHAEALDGCGAALRLDPNHVDAHLNRAAVLAELARDRDAIAAHEACLALNPGRPEALYYSGVAYLQLGDYPRGFERYEARMGLQGKRRPTPPTFTQPIWRGLAPLEGKTILLHSEQGLGDTLQFCRYASLLKAKGARVILQVEPPLVRLLSTLDGADRVVAKGEALPPFDLHSSIMSLPYACGTTLATVPAAVPYLRADPVAAADWGRRLGPAGRRRVGLVWSGRPGGEQSELERRNIPLRLMAPLAAADVDFVSLQKGDAAERELAEAVAAGWDGPPILDLTAGLSDFADTAALVANLDLVVTVDTSIAHLAGALGKPVWILNRYDNCWRWMRERTDSPWYPTARLFRQKRFADWGPVVEEVAGALAAFAKETP